MWAAGVGITGELPDESDQAPADTDQFQDPTERLALALGLQVTQLAHYTHSNPGNPTGAIHKLRWEATVTFRAVLDWSWTASTTLCVGLYHMTRKRTLVPIHGLNTISMGLSSYAELNPPWTASSCYSCCSRLPLSRGMQACTHTSAG